MTIRRGTELPAIGSIVRSIAGRDAGGYFIVVGVADEHHVLLSDGALRPLARPKRKKVKHLRAEPVCLEEVRQRIIDNSLQDAAIRRMLKAHGNSVNEALDRTEGGKTCQNRT